MLEKKANMNRTRVLAVIFVTLLSGCGGYAMTAAEFREQVKKSSMATRETFEVKRPFAEVVRTFQKKAPECLSFSLVSTTQPTIGYASSHVYAKAKPTVVISANKAELHFQVKLQGDMLTEPPGGAYYLVADTYPVSKDRTRVDIYRGRSAVIAQAIRAWASGDDQGCPDPTRFSQ